MQTNIVNVQQLAACIGPSLVTVKLSKYSPSPSSHNHCCTWSQTNTVWTMTSVP